MFFRKKEDYAQYLLSASEMAKIDQEQGFLPEYRGGTPHIPELLMPVGSVVDELYGNIIKDPNYSDDHMEIYLVFCAYAGMGAVQLWNDDWDTLKREGIVESLIKPRGIDEMDEYVTDIIGIGYGSEESDALLLRLKSWGITLLDTIEGGITLKEMFFLAKLMYCYGMIRQMSKMGMH